MRTRTVAHGEAAIGNVNASAPAEMLAGVDEPAGEPEVSESDAAPMEDAAEVTAIDEVESQEDEPEPVVRHEEHAVSNSGLFF